MIEDLEPIEKLYLFEQWVQDRREKAESQRHLALFIGSFTNPEAAKRILDAEANTYASDDTEFELLSQRIHQANLDKDSQSNSGPRRRRKKKKVVG
jgi:hypothetical protein